MPPLETMDRYDKAVLWAYTGVDYSGQVTVDRANPVELEVRWENRRTEVYDSQGKPVTVDAMVVVDREIAVGSSMWLGELADWLGTGSGSGLTDNDVMRVVVAGAVPSIHGRFMRRVVGLVREADALPPSS